MLVCPKCSFDNELGRIFCHQCGAKLDLDKIKPTSGPGRIVRRKRRGGWKRVVGWIIEGGLMAAIVWCLYLITRTPEVQPVKSINAEVLAADNKRIALERAIYQSRPSPTGLQLRLTPAELDTYLNSKGWDKPPDHGFRIEPIALRVELHDGVVTLKYLGTAKWGEGFAKKIFLSYTGLPSVKDGRFEFAPVAAAIGELPIHPSILRQTGFIQNQFQHLFAKLNDEKELLDHLNSILVERDHVLLVCQPKGGAAAPARR